MLGTCLDRGIKSSTTPAASTRPARAGVGRSPSASACTARSPTSTGDDLLPRLQASRPGQALAHPDTGQPLGGAGKPVTANAYLGGWGIAAALAPGADVVVMPGGSPTPRWSSAPAAWWHGWRRNDFDALAGAVLAGHVIECGPQATGGNYFFLDEITDRRYPGFPIAEVAADGSA